MKKKKKYTTNLDNFSAQKKTHLKQMTIVRRFRRFISEGAILLGYEWLYKYRVLDLPWDSLYTWWAAFFFVDFCYYWVHRANHGEEGALCSAVDGRVSV